MQAKKIIFLNQKGGVGKTTTAVNVGSALACEGYRVLLVDLDSQGNLSSSVSADTSKPGIYEVLAGEADVSAIQTTPVEGLYCLSGGINMAGLACEQIPSSGDPVINFSTPTEYVEKISYAKAKEVASKVPEGIVIGADTIGYLNGKVLSAKIKVTNAS